MRVSLAGQWFQPDNRHRPRQCEIVAVCDVMWSVCGQVPAPLTVTVGWYPLPQDGSHLSQVCPRNRLNRPCLRQQRQRPVGGVAQRRCSRLPSPPTRQGTPDQFHCMLTITIFWHPLNLVKTKRQPLQIPRTSL